MAYILDNVTLFLLTPPGVLIVMALLIYFDYLILKSIIKDAYNVNLSKVITNYIQRLASRSLPLTPSQQAVLDIISRKENIGTKEISHDIGIPINTTRKLMKDLVNEGYVYRKVNVHDKRAYCYVASYRYVQGIKKRPLNP